ncbi:MAG: tRNA preQ1(34) S-adenosylmethionine ribosyltransferase-isomerase QueA [Candidatus Omnitrophota bacterium]
MKLSDFDYTLPQELIAQYPAQKRDSSRMLVLDKNSGKIQHRNFTDLPDYLNKNDAIVFNDTKVFKARLIGNRQGFSGRIELLLLRENPAGTFECLAKPAKKLSKGTVIEFADSKLTATIVGAESETRYVSFQTNGASLDKCIEKIGIMPLPPYIKRQPVLDDEKRYQTIYAKNSGAAAAPTAGLHFTDTIIKKITAKGAKTVYITLHVGYATFKPVTADAVEAHKMHSEYFKISKNAASAINKAGQNNGKVLAVGTTVCRALESAAGVLNAQYSILTTQNETKLFIYPGYNFKITDMLLTNFHLPKTTLLMLVSAFGGYDNIMRAYQEAIEQKYRFYSYGDCMLIV